MGLLLRMGRRGDGEREVLTIGEIRDIMGLDAASRDSFARAIPFALHDVTAGSENEFQTAVAGRAGDVDLPVTIVQSDYYANMVRRFKAGETPRKMITEIERYLDENNEGTWENSWVRFPRSLLGDRVDALFMSDLLADKRDPAGPLRGDADEFIFRREGEEYVRIPVSYLLKISLYDAVRGDRGVHPVIRSAGEKMTEHFLNDNTSPETYSFSPVALGRYSRTGLGIARETAKRLLLTQFLVAYGNVRFGLTERGQRVVLYMAPHPPVRQKRLNDIISDSFYRDLFMNPCLSGWDRGEEKFRYMGLCHQVLSRSQLNAVSKLKEAGIITRNLVVLPNMSNISLANNGTHISLGSLKLTALLADPSSGFGPSEEKHLGDLAIKIIEHFVPLFVGTYSAAPYRLDFEDFHPEKALGFLPHELDYTHLRMIWRRWIKKADLGILGRPVTPFGPQWLDSVISRLLGLKGDFLCDFRLIDYLVAVMSTEQSPALDGRKGNAEKLKKDLAGMGVFDKGMSLYLLYRQREFARMGFSGFEGRYYSLFENIIGDLGEAAGLQALLTALAFKYILTEAVSHGHIPDTPTVESERRQIFFGTAIGIPTFYVRKDTPNLFLMRILKKVQRARLSHRYPGYIRIYNLEYRRALVEIIEEDGSDLIELMGLKDVIEGLKARIMEPARQSAGGRLTRGILDVAGSRSAMSLSARDFNLAAEKYYRERLRRRHIEEALAVLEEDLVKIDSHALCKECLFQEGLRAILRSGRAASFLGSLKKDLADERATEEQLRKLIHLTILTIVSDMKQNETETFNREGL